MAERREPVPVRPEEGPALDLGDLDWTIPPDSQVGGPAGTGAGPSLPWVASRVRTAGVHATVSMLVTGLLLGWWVASGRMPTTDPSIGVLALLLHIGAFLTAWLSLRASVDAWQSLYLRPGQTAPHGNMTQILSVLSLLVMCFHAAMVLSAVLV